MKKRPRHQIRKSQSVQRLLASQCLITSVYLFEKLHLRAVFNLPVKLLVSKLVWFVRNKMKLPGTTSPSAGLTVKLTGYLLQLSYLACRCFYPVDVELMFFIPRERNTTSKSSLCTFYHSQHAVAAVSFVENALCVLDCRVHKFQRISLG